MSDKNNVNNIVQEVDMYIDKALNGKDKENLVKNIQNNPVYSKVYEQQVDFRNFIKDNLKRPQVSSEFKESIKESLRSI